MITASCPPPRLLPRCVPKGYNAAQLAMPRAIAGIEDFAHITDKQLAEIRTAFAAQDVEISVLSCYQDLSAPDADARRAAVDAVKRTLGYAKVLGAKMVGSETAWGACTDEEKAARRPLMLDSIARITEEAARLERRVCRGIGGRTPPLHAGAAARPCWTPPLIYSPLQGHF